MKRFNVWFVIGLVYIGWMTALIFGAVGKVPSGEPLTRIDGLFAFGFVAIPFVLGYFAKSE